MLRIPYECRLQKLLYSYNRIIHYTVVVNSSELQCMYSNITFINPNSCTSTDILVSGCYSLTHFNYYVKEH